MDKKKLNRLKLVLVEKDKTGVWLAEQLGVSACTVSRWASNTAQPNLSTLNDIAKLLDVDVKELIKSEKNNFLKSATIIQYTIKGRFMSR